MSDVKGKSMTVSWTPPKDDGGCPLDGYILEYKMDGTFKWQPVSEEPVPDTKYNIQVRKSAYFDQIYNFNIIKYWY